MGEKQILNEDVKIIQLSHAESGAVGIRIALSDIKEGVPVIVSPVKMKEGTVVYAVDSEYFYAYYADVDSDLKRDRPEGVAAIYQLHNSFTHKPIVGLSINGNRQLVDNQGKPLGYEALADILSSYDGGFVAYNAQLKEVGRKGLGEIEPTGKRAWFDYTAAAENPVDRPAFAYALLSREQDVIKISAAAENLSPPTADGKAATSLASKKFVIK